MNLLSTVDRSIPEFSFLIVGISEGELTIFVNELNLVKDHQSQ